MELHKVPFNEVESLSFKDVSYATEAEKFKDFLTDVPSMEGLKTALKIKKQNPIDRNLVVNVLKKQYDSRKLTEIQAQNLKNIQDTNGFTIITAHQPCLLTGPLYYVYKILSTINLAEKASLELGHPIVPLFISGGEDHDFEEMNHFKLFNDTVTWENNDSGPVGKMDCASLMPTVESVIERLGKGEEAEYLSQLFKDSFKEGKAYGTAMLDLTNTLFASYGLLVLDMSDPAFKKAFIPYIKEEILYQRSKSLVQETQEALNQFQFSNQAFVRPINFFYIQPNRRDRIVFEDGVFKVLDTNLTFSKEEMEKEIEAAPDKFSPNVVMRPLFQESMLPNLAYIGGGGEIAYWLERKSQFDHFKVPFPILIRRNSVLWVDPAGVKKLDKLNLSVLDLFQKTEPLKKTFIEQMATKDLNIDDHKKTIASALQHIEKLGKSIDPTLGPKLASESTKIGKQIDMFQSWIERAEKQKHQIALNQLEKLKEKYFPANGLQERKDNFIPFYLKYGATFFEYLKENLNPFDEGFVVIVDRGTKN